MVLKWTEIIKFIKNEFKLIVLLTVIFSGGFLFILTRNETVVDSNIEEEIGDVDYVTDENPANFHFYIENTEGSIFTNNLVLEQYFLSENELDKLSDNVNFDLKKLIADTENNIKVNYNLTGESKVIGISRNESTHLMEFIVNVGDRRDSLKIANYYFNLINNNEVPLLATKNLSMFSNPKIKDVDSVEVLLSDEAVEQTEDSFFLKIITSLILALMISMIIIFVKIVFNKKLVYSFTYNIRESDYFLLIDQKNNDVNILEDLLKAASSNTLLVHENLGTNNKKTQFISDDSQDNKFLQTDDILKYLNYTDLKQVFLVVEENETSRDWYNKQRKLESVLNVQTFVVQINNLR